jgi:hypothetical protein
MKLHRYWFEFDHSLSDSPPPGTLLGCGVTARDRDDAIALIKASVFHNRPFPPIKREVQDIDISSLDAGHVRPSMGNIFARGVWFPLGYDLR